MNIIMNEAPFEELRVKQLESTKKQKERAKQMLTFKGTVKAVDWGFAISCSFAVMMLTMFLSMSAYLANNTLSLSVIFTLVFGISALFFTGAVTISVCTHISSWKEALTDSNSQIEIFENESKFVDYIKYHRKELYNQVTLLSMLKNKDERILRVEHSKEKKDCFTIYYADENCVVKKEHLYFNITEIRTNVSEPTLVWNGEAIKYVIPYDVEKEM